VRDTIHALYEALGGGKADILIAELQEAGIDCIMDRGGVEIAGHRVLGKGWAGLVLAALRRGRPVAVKVLKPRGRRRSLLSEGIAAYAAARLGVFKPVHYVGRNVLVYELIEGPTLAEYGPRSVAEAQQVLSQLLEKAYRLDVIGLRHNELARPDQQVIVEHGQKPYIIDYESATWCQTPASNLTQLIGGLPRTPIGRCCRIHILLKDPVLRSLLRRYKAAKTLKEKRYLYRSIAELLISACSEATAP